MDAVFTLGEEARTNFLLLILESFGCTYICLWSYLPYPSNRFLFSGGYYQEENNQAGSSSVSPARRHFDQYCREPLFAVNDRVPGTAYKNNRPYIELKELELQRWASTDAQKQFYREAKIKIAVFMGCRSGEIELGWSNVTQLDIATEMRNWFPEDFSRQSPMRGLDRKPPSSSSSSLQSLSMDSPQSSSLLFNIPSTTDIPESLHEAPLLQPIPCPFQEVMQSLHQIPSTTTPLTQQVMQYLQPTPSTISPLQQAAMQLHSSQSIPSTSNTNPLQQSMQSLQPLMPSTSSNTPHQQAMQAFALARNIQLPNPECEEAAMISAILAVLTSPSMLAVSSSPSSSSSSSSTCGLPHIIYGASPGSSAFKNYRSALAPTTATRTSFRKHSILKRAIVYYRRLNTEKREHMLIAGRPTSTQLQHMIAERKRREKINESFKALSSLLPTEVKKDKATVLSRTREYVASLKAEVEELTKKNQQLEAQLSRAGDQSEVGESSNERVNVQIAHLPESPPDQRIIDLQVTLIGECPVIDMVIEILEFLKQVRNVNVMSTEARTHVAESTSFARVSLRLSIEGNEWDESAFQEAVRRVVADLAQCQYAFSA